MVIPNKQNKGKHMKYIKLLVAAFVASLFVTAASAAPSTNLVASTTDDLGPWTFALSGQGNSTLNNNSAKFQHSNIGAEFQVGYNTTVVFPTELGVRQVIGYNDADSAQWFLSTKVYSDWKVIRLGNLEADAGANVGNSYGTTTGDWTAAPEIVGRLYLKKDVDVFGRVEYPYDLTKGATEDTLTYTIGLRVRF